MALTPTALRVRIVHAQRYGSAKDRSRTVTRAVCGHLLAVLMDEHVHVYGDVALRRQFFSRDDAELAALGSSEDEMFATAARNTAIAPIQIEVMRVTDDCRIFFFQGLEDEDDSTAAARMLDIEALRAHVAATLDDVAGSALGKPNGNGAIVSVPSSSLMCAFFVDGGDFQTGVENVLVNTLAEYDEDDEASLSPWLYWAHRGGIVELRYTLDADGGLEDLELPDALVPQWGAE